jgi:hypothetical protein
MQLYVWVYYLLREISFPICWSNASSLPYEVGNDSINKVHRYVGRKAWTAQTNRKQQTTTKLIEFDVLTAVVMRTPTFWVITPCSPLKLNRRFGGTCLQGRRVRQVRNPTWRPLLNLNELHSVNMIFLFFFTPWRRMGEWMYRSTFCLHGVIS